MSLGLEYMLNHLKARWIVFIGPGAGCYLIEYGELLVVSARQDARSAAARCGREDKSKRVAALFVCGRSCAMYARLGVNRFRCVGQGVG